jgi:hypothetical protein
MLHQLPERMEGVFTAILLQRVGLFLCRFSDAGRHDASHGLRWPASEKRQGTKSRAVGAVEQRALWGFCRALGREEGGLARLR